MTKRIFIGLLVTAIAFGALAPSTRAQSLGWNLQFGTSSTEAIVDVEAYGSWVFATGYTEGVLSDEAYWTAQTSGTTDDLFGVHMTGVNDGVAVGDFGLVVRTTDGGTTWNQVVVPGLGDRLYDVFFVDASNGWAVGTSGHVAKTINGGASWTLPLSGPPITLYGVAFVDQSTGVAVGSSGNVLRSTDGGNNWGAASVPNDITLYAVDFADANIGVAVGEAGEIIRTTDAGANWTGVVSGVATDLNDVYFTSATVGYAVGEVGTILKTTDAGLNWTVQPSGVISSLRGVHFSSNMVGTAVGNGVILRTDDGGASWFTQLTVLNDLASVYLTTGGIATAAGATGAILRNTQGRGAGRDVWVARFTQAGSLTWIRQFSSDNDDEPLTVHADASGVYIGGWAGGPLPGGSFSGGGTDGFIAKYSLTGAPQWVRQFGVGVQGNVAGIDGDGTSIYAAAWVPETFDEVNSGAFLRKYDADTGAEVWTEQFGNTFNDECTDVVLGDDGGVYVSGFTFGAFSGFSNLGERDAFLVKYDDAGTQQWAQQFGTTGDDYAQSVTFQGGKAVVVGNVTGALPGWTFGGGRDIFVRAYDVVGGEQWTDQIATAGSAIAGGVAGDGTGVYISGGVQVALPGQTDAGGSYDAFVRKYVGFGSIAWTNQFGTTGDEIAYAVAASGTGVYAGGGTDGALFPTQNAFQDNFLAELSPLTCPPGGVLYVDSAVEGVEDGLSWSSAFSTLQQALAAAEICAPVEIWVRQGTYYSSLTGNRGDSFQMINDVAVYGGFFGNETVREDRAPIFYTTTLSGDLGIGGEPDDNSYHVVTAGEGVDATAVLDGFTITGGNANGTAPEDRGGGIFNPGFGSPTFGNLIIQNNQCALLGAGVYTETGVPTFTDVEVLNNISDIGGGGVYNAGGQPRFFGARFGGNTAVGEGGGMRSSGEPLLEDVVFESNAAGFGVGLWTSGDATIRRCVFESNVGGTNGGGILIQGGEPFITNTLVADNQVSNRGGGIWVGTGATPTIVNVTVAGNSATTEAGGVWFGTGTISTLYNTVVYQNTATEGGTLLNNGTTTWYSCLVEGSNGSGVSWNVAYGNDAGGNIDGEPQFDDPGGSGGYRLLSGSIAIDAGDLSAPGYGTLDLDNDPRVSGSGIDMGAYEFTFPCPPGNVYFVSNDAVGNNDGTSWANAFNSLQDALLATVGCPSVTEIWVEAGTYLPTSGLDRTATFQLVNGIDIYGGFDGTETERSQRNWQGNITNLSGDIAELNNAADNSYHVVTAGPTITSNTVLDGFFIRHGNANGGGGDDNGAGFYNPFSGVPTVSNCWIYQNNATYAGGGVYNEGDATFTNVIIAENTSGNDGGGVWQGNFQSAVYENCLFRENVGFFGGGIRTGGVSEFLNCIFDRNQALGGAGMQNFGDALVINCTFSLNEGTNDAFNGGGMANGDAAVPRIHNTIFWGNTALSGVGDQIFNDVGANPEIFNSIIEGSGGSNDWNPALGEDNGGNIDLDPQFTGAAFGGLEVELTSPAVDAGNNAAPSLPATDFAGNSRIQNGVVDIGAFETPALMAGDLVWFRSFGGDLTDRGEDIASDATGVYVGGWTDDEIPGQTTSGFIDAFVRKYDAEGNELWTSQFGTTSAEDIWGITTGGGRVFATGSTGGDLGGVNQGSRDFFISRLDANGTNLVSWQFGTTAFENAYAIDYYNGLVFVTGYTNGDYAAANAGGQDAIIAVYDSSGAFQWSAQWGTTSSDVGEDIAVDGTGVYVAGTSGINAYVRKYDPAGDFLWQQDLATANLDWGYGIDADDALGVYVTGKTQGDLFGTAQGLVNAYIARLDPTDGSVIWSDQFGNGPDPSDAVQSHALRIDATGVYIAGDVSGAPLSGETASGLTDGFVRAYSFVGGVLWTEQFGNGGFVTPEGVAAGPLGVFAGGRADPAPGATTGAAAGLGTEAFAAQLLAGTAGADSDGDGVEDLVDLCPSEDASGFDRNGDGCIDDGAGGRHVEYWGIDDPVITYVVNQDGAPAVGDGTDFTAIQAGVEAWTALPGVDVTTSYGGTTPQAVASALDQVNLITFEDTEYDFPSAVLAVGVATSFETDSLFNARLYRPGEIVDADIIFNPAKPFTTPSAGGSGSDIQSVITHEAGHFFGLSHSAKVTSTMFFVLPPGTNAAALTGEDEGAFVKAYPDAATLASGNRISGTVIDGATSLPVPGAAVFLVAVTTGDTVGCEYTLPDGSYEFLGLATDSYNVSIHPLDGSSAVGFIQPANINSLIANTAQTLFVPEWWNDAESATDDPSVRTAIAVAGNPAVADFITNIDATPPSVVNVSPANGEAGIRIDTAVIIRFSEPIDSETLTGNFALRDTTTGLAVGGSAAILNDDSTIAFTPSNSLGFETTYRLELGTGLSDKFGNGLSAPFNSTFDTEVQPALSITSLAPSKGVPGTVVVVNGNGFDPVGGTDVLFEGVSATVLDVTATSVVVQVPANAVSGNVVAQIGGGDAVSNALSFTVLQGGGEPRAFEIGSTVLGGLPRLVEVLPSGAFAYVATDAGFSAVDVEPGSAGFLSATDVTIPGGLDGLDILPGGNRAFAVGTLNQELHVIDTNFTPAAPNPSFNTVLQSIPLADAPLGIVAGPTGRRVYIPTDAGEIQKWDVFNPSAPFQVGAIVSPDPNLRGRLAITPDGARLLVPAGTGNLLVFNTGNDSLEATIPVGGDPRDVVVDPAGQRAYVTDDGGTVAVVNLDLLQNIQSVTSGGTLRGATITPAGDYLYAANRQLNFIDVVDLVETNPTFRTVVQNIPQPINPVDVERSPDGAYAYSLIESDQTMVTTAIGFGPEVRTLSRLAGPEGAWVVVGGSGLKTDSSTTVSFNGVTAPVTLDSDRRLSVAVPAGATSGPVKVVGTNPTGPQTSSNEVFFDVLGPTAPGGLRLADRTAPSGTPGLTSVMDLSDAAKVVVFGGSGGGLWVMDINPGSSSYNQVVGSVSAGLPASPVADVALSVDGLRAFALYETPGEVYAVNVNLFSPDFGEVAQIDLTGASSAFNVAIQPDGAYLLVSDPTGTAVHFVPLDESSPLQYAIESTVDLSSLGTGDVREIAFHPTGRWAYATIRDPANALVAVMDVSAPELSSTVAMPGVNPQEIPLSLSFTPDGDRCFVLTSQILGIENRSVVTMDTSNPVAPVVVGSPQAYGNTGPTGEEQIRVSPRGDRALFNLRGGGFYYNAYTAGEDSIQFLEQTPAVFFSLTRVEFEFTADASRVYAASAARDSIFVYDFSQAASIAKQSGDLQTGVVNAQLPSAVRVLVQDGGSNPVSGVAVEFEVTAGGGVLAATGTPTRTVATDANGVALVNWVIGPTVGNATNTLTVTSGTLSGSPLTFTASGVSDPNLVPLTLAQGDLIPVDGKTNVSTTTSVQAKFSRAVDPASVTSSTFFLRRASTAQLVPVIRGFSNGNRNVSLTPTRPLVLGENYEFQITSGVVDGNGGALQNPASATFATLPAPPPLALDAIDPPSSRTNVTVVLSGTSFDSVPAGNTILFNNVAVTPDAGGVDYLNVTVPLNAATGPVRVVSGADTSNAINFTVLATTTSTTDEVLATVGTGTATKSLTVKPDGSIAYTVSPGANTVIPIDIVGETAFPAIPVGENPVSIDVTPNGRRVYVSNLVTGTVSAIDSDPTSPDFNTVVETIPVGSAPIDLAVGPDGDRVYVSNSGSGDLSVIDADESSETFDQVLATVGTGKPGKTIAVSPDGTVLYLGTDDGYIVFDPVDYGVLATVGGGKSTKTVKVSPDGTLLFLLTTEGEVLVYDVDPASDSPNQVLATVGSGKTTKNINVSPDGTLLYLIQDEEDIIIVYDIEVVSGVSAVEEPPCTVCITPVDTLMVGEDPAAIVFDPSGSGTAIVTSPGNNTVVILGTEPKTIAVSLEVTPSTLNPKSKGRFVNGRIEPANPGDALLIDPSSVRLENIPIVPGSEKIEDVDEDGIEELAVKFDRAAFQDSIPQGEYVPVTITGLLDGAPFAGTDTIRTLRPNVKKPASGSFVIVGLNETIEWESPSGRNIDAVDVHWTADDGETWSEVALGIQDAGSVGWSVPQVLSDQCRVMVTIYENGEVLGIGMTPQTFTITAPVSVKFGSFKGSAGDGAAVLEWETANEYGTRGFNLLRADARDGVFEPVNDAIIDAKGDAMGAQYRFRDETVKPNHTVYYMLQEVAELGDGQRVGPVEVRVSLTNALGQNIPNPFNPATTIRYAVARDGLVRLMVYDVKGRRVRTLVNESQRANFYTVEWDGTNDQGQRVASGVYFYRITAGKFNATKKMLLLK